MSKTSVSISGGVGFFGLLTVIFITLKLLGNIDWSWWWVLTTLWGPAILAVLLALGYIFIEFWREALDTSNGGCDENW